MDILERQYLEERIFNAIQLLLSVSDLHYLQSLSRSAFLDALEHELRFLGFYADNDEETSYAIHNFLEQNVDQWLLDVYQIQDTMFTELVQLPQRHISTSHFLHTIENSPSILSLMKTTHFFGFMPLQHTHIQTGKNTL
jgi:hypothetical protein